MTDLEALRAFYRHYLNDYPEGGGWPSVAEADEVYTNATSSVVIPWDRIGSILDVGSGTGAFLPYLRRQKNFRGRYIGIEALDVLSDTTPAEVLNDSKARFVKGDFLSAGQELDLRADWVFAIGTLGTDQPRKAEYDLAMILRMVEVANLGFTIDLNDIRVISAERLQAVPGLVAHDLGLLLTSFLPRIRYSEIHIVHDEHRNCALNCLLTRVAKR